MLRQLLNLSNSSANHLFSVLCKAKTQRNQLDYSKVSPLVYAFLFTESAPSAMNSVLHNVIQMLCSVKKKISNNSSIFHDFILLFSPVYFLPRQLTEPSKRNRTSFHCNLYQSWEMSFPKSMCEGRGRAIGVQEETEATEEGSDGVGGELSGPVWNQSRKD